MAEQFKNNASSTLNGAINNSTTTVVIQSADTSKFPTTGDFRLLIGTNPSTAEIVLVTGVSGATFTVVRGQENTTASSWPDLTTVTHILTAGAVEQIRTQFVTVGNELYTTKTVSVDPNGTVASSHGDGYSKLFVNGNILATKFSAGEIPASFQTFSYVSDALQAFVVPAGVTSIKVKMWGPGGGTGNYSGSGGGGPGGFSTGYLSVTPGETLYLAVGSGGKHPVSTSGNGGNGGWPGGGFGTRGDASGGGGGGFTGIFNTSMTQGNALMIAGGGGGSTGFGSFGAGGGGGSTGGSGTSGSGFGGSQVAGGNGGGGSSSPPTAGVALAGGTAFTDQTTSTSNDCGGGGSGYFGGGAGQGDGRAGGGGSGFLHATRVTGGTTTTGSNAGSGNTTTSPPNTTDPYYSAGIGLGAAATGAAGTDGGNGYVVFQWGGISSLDVDSIDFGNGSSISTVDTSLTISPPTGGTVTLSAAGALGTIALSPTTSGLITLSSTTDIAFTSGTSSVLFNMNSAQKFKMYSSGAIVVGPPETWNDTSSEAQAGFTGPIINLSAITGGSITSTANQALVFNNAGFGTIQGHNGVTFRVNTSIGGFFDSNLIFRTGPSSNSTATLQGATWPIAGTDYSWMYNSSGSCWSEIIAGGSANRAAIQIWNNATSNTCGVSLFGAGTGHGTVEYAGNGTIEQSGNSTSGLIFTKRNGTDGLSFASTGAIWQSGAWTIGRSTQNDTSTEAQAGLTGPLLNLTQITGGTQTSTANQSLLYNNAGTVTLQGHVGHALIANTTTIASTSTSKFITNAGRRLATNVRTANYTVQTTDEVIIVGTLSSSITITLPTSPTAGDTYTVKDQAGGTAINNVIISGNGNNIDGASTYTMNTNYESVTVVFANGSWSII